MCLHSRLCCSLWFDVNLNSVQVPLDKASTKQLNVSVTQCFYIPALLLKGMLNF